MNNFTNKIILKNLMKVLNFVRIISYLFVLSLICFTIPNKTFAISPATVNPNPKGSTVSSMSATLLGNNLINFGSILGGVDYPDGFLPFLTHRAGMYGHAIFNANYTFFNSGSINISGNNQAYSMYAYATRKGAHTLTNTGSITLHGDNT